MEDTKVKSALNDLAPLLTGTGSVIPSASGADNGLNLVNLQDLGAKSIEEYMSRTAGHADKGEGQDSELSPSAAALHPRWRSASESDRRKRHSRSERRMTKAEFEDRVQRRSTKSGNLKSTVSGSATGTSTAAKSPSGARPYGLDSGSSAYTNDAATGIKPSKHASRDAAQPARHRAGRYTVSVVTETTHSTAPPKWYEKPVSVPASVVVPVSASLPRHISLQSYVDENPKQFPSSRMSSVGPSVQATPLWMKPLGSAEAGAPLPVPRNRRSYFF